MIFKKESYRMNRNIEIKARITDFSKQCEKAGKLSGQPPQKIHQEDIFFTCPLGRLKLRIFSADRGELIYYERNNQAGPKQSNYLLTGTDDPEGLKNVLASAWGIRGVVRKVRLLYLVGQTRVHLDRVENLGDFLEFEVVMRPDQTAEQGIEIAEAMMDAFEIRNEDLVDSAYIDLIEGDHRE